MKKEAKTTTKKTADKKVENVNKMEKELMMQNPMLYMGMIMDMVHRCTPEGDLLLAYISELEKKVGVEECIKAVEKVMKAGKKK